MEDQRNSQATKERIVQTAEALFAEHGYDATGVAEICSQAGITKGGFYHHFPSKQALFLELLTRWLDILDGQLAAFSAAAETVPQALSQMAGAMGHILAAGSGHLPMFLEFWSRAARDPEVFQTTIAPYRRYREYLAEFIRRGIQEGSLRQVDPEAAALSFVSMAVGLLLQGLLDPQGTDWEKAARQGVALMLDGLKSTE
jgi:AcrR family transcriptional regulator